MSWRSHVSCFSPRMMSWIHSVLHISVMWILYIQMCHLMMHQLLLRVFFYSFWGQFKNKAASHYITRHHTAISNGKNPPLQHKPRGVIHTVWCLDHTNYGSGSACCNWKHDMCMKFVQKKWVHMCLWKHKCVEHVAANSIIIPLFA